jgi:L-asparaginase II
VRGHVAVVDAAGELLAGAGDPAAVTTLRSCVKPLQALVFVRHAVDEVDAGQDELAVACASHNGEPVHVETVRRLLGRCGLDDGALSCGPQLPYDDDAARAILAAGEEPGRIHNNCSGKHAAMLAVCTVRGWPTAAYAAWDHPLQVEIRHLMGGFGAVDLDSSPVGVDGCGLPSHGLPLRVLARMFAAATHDGGFRRCQDAMAAHPHLVAGRGRFDTALLAAAGDRITLKGGGAAVWAAVRRPAGPGLAIKLEAGDAAALPAVALAALEALDWLGPEVLGDDRLVPFRRPSLRNWAGAVVGSIEAEPGWTAALAG